jgi:hypothetical protein
MGGVIHNEKYWNINSKDKFDLRLPKHFIKLYYIFNLFMSDKPYINPPTFTRFHEARISCATKLLHQGI